MKLRPTSRFATIWLAFSLGSSLCGADEGSEELARARMAFEKEVDFSTRPIRDRYLSRLENLKRGLGSRGDARGAAAVQDEIDRVKALVIDPGIAKYVGPWKITFTNGETRHYIISLDGTVMYDEQSGKRLTPPVKGRLTLKGNEAFLDFQDGGIHRIKQSGKNLFIEIFSVKDGVPEGQPVAKGTATPSA